MYNWSHSGMTLMGHVYESGEEMNIVVFCRLLVSAPWSGFSRNRKGDVYKCPVLGSRNSCDKLNLEGKAWCFIVQPLTSLQNTVHVLKH